MKAHLFLLHRCRAVGIATALAAAACSHRPPPRLSVELTARATAKLDVVELVVSDRVRAARLRAIYLDVAKLGRELDLARAKASFEHCAFRAPPTPAGAGTDPIGSGALECALAPPLAGSQASLDRYVALMLEARALLTQDEFEKLERMR